MTSINKPLNEVAKIITGKTPPTEIKEYFDGMYPFITPSDIPTFQERKLKKNSIERFLSERGAEYQKRLLIPADAICFVAIGSTVGKMCLTSEPSFTNQQIHSLIPQRGIDGHYLFYHLRYIHSGIKSIADSSGSGKPIINKSDFGKIKITAPSLDTQQKIAGILSAYDDLIENNSKRIALLEKAAEEIYREWFVRMRFAGWDKVKFVKGVPEGWETLPLSEVAQFNIRSIKKGRNFDFINYVDISSVTTHQINDFEKIPFSMAPGRARRIVKHGDIIWSTVRPANRAFCLIFNPIENLIVSTGFAVITSNENMPYSFLYYAVTSDAFVDHIAIVAKGAAYPAADIEDFKKNTYTSAET